MKRVVSGIMLTLIFIGISTWAFNISMVRADPGQIDVELGVTPEYPTIYDEVRIMVKVTINWWYNFIEFGNLTRDGNSFSVILVPLIVAGLPAPPVTYIHTYNLGKLPEGSYEFKALLPAPPPIYLTVAATLSFNVSVPPPPVYSLTIFTTAGGTTNPAPGTYTYTAGSSIQVTAIPSSGYAFNHWELDDVNVGSANPYTVLMDQDHTLKAVFYVQPLSVSITPLTAEIKVGESVTFSSTVSGGLPPYSYQWYINGTAVGGATSQSWMFTPETPGTYIIHLNVTDSTLQIAKSNTATVTVAPQLVVSISPTSASILVGQSVIFTSTVTGGYPSYSYQWYLDEAPVLGATSASWTFTPSTAGTYYVQLKVTDDKNNIAQSDVSRITVVTVPVGGYSIPINVKINTEPTTPYIIILATITIGFTIIKRKTTKIQE